MAPAFQLSDPQRLDWLRLIRSENVGPRTFRTLVNTYGGASAALDALPELARRGGASRNIKRCSRDEALREINGLQRLGGALVGLGEPAYPARLREIDDAPPLLAVMGDLAVLGRPIIAIVGSRNASAAGLKFAERLAADLGTAGYATASGLARGIDAAAHRASLRTGTIAALAGGLDRIYPPEHLKLAEAVRETGVLITEMPLGWEPRARDFPRRNRLISGVALGVVVIEAAVRSGSLITARMALEQGRDVFAVPGSPLDPRAAGTNGLLKQGATLVTEAADVISAVAPMLGQTESQLFEEPTAPAAEPEGGERATILRLLGPSPVSLDDLIRLSGASVGVVRTVLLELELAGRLERHGAGLVSLT